MVVNKESVMISFPMLPYSAVSSFITPSEVDSGEGKGEMNLTCQITSVSYLM